MHAATPNDRLTSTEGHAADARSANGGVKRQKLNAVPNSLQDAAWVADEDPALCILALKAARDLREQGWAVVEGVLSRCGLLICPLYAARIRKGPHSSRSGQKGFGCGSGRIATAISKGSGSG